MRRPKVPPLNGWQSLIVGVACVLVGAVGLIAIAIYVTRPQHESAAANALGAAAFFLVASCVVVVVEVIACSNNTDEALRKRKDRGW